MLHDVSFISLCESSSKNYEHVQVRVGRLPTSLSKAFLSLAVVFIMFNVTQNPQGLFRRKS